MNFRNISSILFICLVVTFFSNKLLFAEDSSSPSTDSVSVIKQSLTSASIANGSLEPQLNTGAAVSSIPLDLPPAKGNLHPSIGISYNSNGDNSILGVGWHLGLSYIEFENREITEDIEYVINIGGSRKKLIAVDRLLQNSILKSYKTTNNYYL